MAEDRGATSLAKKWAVKKLKFKKRKKSGEGGDQEKHGNSQAKVKGGVAGMVEPEKVLFQTIWSDEDEIGLLKQMIDYKIEKEALPTANRKDFCDFVKEYLQNNADHDQVRNKMWKLREKFNLLFAKKALEVMNVGVQIPQAQVITEGNQTWEGGFSEVLSDLVKAASSRMGVNESIVERRLKMCDVDKVTEIGEKWRMLLADKFELKRRETVMYGQLLEMVGEALR